MLSKVILLFLLSQVSSDVSVPEPLQCKNPKSTICSIQVLKHVDFHPPELPSLVGKHTLQIRSGTATRFSNDFQLKLAPILKLQLGRLNIESLWIMPTLLQLSAENNLIEQLIIDKPVNETGYRLQYLNLASNRLRSIRELKDLHALKELRLDDNLLEYIEMDTFAGMSKLKKLSLSHNRINAIATTDPIELPSLEFFSLAHNNLTKLAVKNWTLLQLTDLQLNQNRLISLDVENFDQFVSLEKLSIAGNSWYCFWLSKAIKNIGRYVTLNGKDADCPATMPIDDICCSMTVVSEDQPAHADVAERIRLFEESQTRIKDGLYQKLGRAKTWWNEEFAKIEVKTRELKRDADELARLSSDDNKVKPEDMQTLREGLEQAEDNVNNVQSLIESNGKFEQEITNLLYMVIEQKNRLVQTVKNFTNLQEGMHAYKISFDNNVK